MKAFDSEEKLWGYLRGQANLNSSSHNGKWGFVYYSHRLLKDFTEMTDVESFRNIVPHSVSQEKNILVIHQGNPQTPQCFLVTPDLDAARLKRDWCKAYAATHGLQIVMG
jgi:hypothetical protein